MTSCFQFENAQILSLYLHRNLTRGDFPLFPLYFD